MYRYIRCIGVLAVFALAFHGCKDSSKGIVVPSILAPVARISLKPPTGVVYVNQILTIDWSCENSTSAEPSWAQAYGGTIPLSHIGEQWSKGEPGNYSLTLRCMGAGGIDVVTVLVTVAPLPMFSGKIFGFSESSVFQQSRITLTNGTTSLTSMAEPNGAFSLTNSLYSEDCLKLSVEEEASNSDLIPSLARVCGGYSNEQVVLRHPLKQRVSGGVYAGFERNANLSENYTMSGDGISSFYRRFLLNDGWFYHSKSIAPDVILPLVIDRTGSNLEFDSTAERTVSEALRILQETTGKERFRFTTVSSLPPGQGVRITLRSEHPYYGSAGSTVDRAGNIIGGIVIFRGAGNITLSSVIHELIHVMGFGHTCSWPTIMYTGCSVGIARSLPTPEDIANIEYFYKSRERQIETVATHGLASALNGQLSQRGLPPEWPSAWTNSALMAMALEESITQMFHHNSFEFAPVPGKKKR